MTVTKIEAVTKNKYKIDLDERFAFVLYKGEMSRFGIREGAVLTKDTCEKVYGVVKKRAKLRAMHLLTDMPRTESELREKLKAGMYPAEAVEEAIRYVSSYGYLNDRIYVQNYILSKRYSKSRREIYARLLAKGVDSELIDEAYEQYEDETGDRAAIRRLIEKKNIDLLCADEKELHKLYGFLARKGFNYEDIRQVIQNYNENA